MAFIRFVNALVDNEQKSQFAQSISGIAEAIGLPGWFVDLRHAATHDHLPSLGLLLNACSQGVEWLQSNYWAMQSVNEMKRDSVDLFVKTFKSTRKSEINANVAPLKSIAYIAPAIASWDSERATSMIISSLLEKGNFVPLSKAKRSKSVHDDIPPALQALWMPFLERMDSLDNYFIQELFVALVELVASDVKLSSSCRLTLVCWSRELLSFFILKEKPAVHIACLQVCLRYSNSSLCRGLVDTIVKSSTLDSTNINMFKQYTASITSTKLSQNTSDDPVDFSILEHRIATLKKQGSRKRSRWNLVSDFKPCPIGFNIGGLDLPVSLDGVISDVHENSNESVGEVDDVNPESRPALFTAEEITRHKLRLF